MFIGIYSRSQVSIYRTIGPLVYIANRFVTSKIYDKRDDFNFPFLDGDVPRSASYDIYI